MAVAAMAVGAMAVASMAVAAMAVALAVELELQFAVAVLFVVHRFPTRTVPRAISGCYISPRGTKAVVIVVQASRLRRSSTNLQQAGETPAPRLRTGDVILFRPGDFVRPTGRSPSPRTSAVPFCTPGDVVRELAEPVFSHLVQVGRPIGRSPRTD